MGGKTPETHYETPNIAGDFRKLGLTAYHVANVQRTSVLLGIERHGTYRHSHKAPRKPAARKKVPVKFRRNGLQVRTKTQKRKEVLDS